MWTILGALSSALCVNVWKSQWYGAPVFSANQTTAIHIGCQKASIIQIYIRGYYFAYLPKDLHAERRNGGGGVACTEIAAWCCQYCRPGFYCCSLREWVGTIKLVLDWVPNLAVSISTMVDGFVIVVDILRQITKWGSTVGLSKYSSD